MAILANGLFPHGCLLKMIWVKDDGSLTKYVCQPLSWDELLMLWDVPILFRGLLDKLPDDLAEMEHLLASPPGKFLEL